MPAERALQGRQHFAGCGRGQQGEVEAGRKPGRGFLDPPELASGALGGFVVAFGSHQGAKPRRVGHQTGVERVHGFLHGHRIPVEARLEQMARFHPAWPLHRGTVRLPPGEHLRLRHHVGLVVAQSSLPPLRPHRLARQGFAELVGGHGGRRQHGGQGFASAEALLGVCRGFGDRRTIGPGARRFAVEAGVGHQIVERRASQVAQGVPRAGQGRQFRTAAGPACGDLRIDLPQGKGEPLAPGEHRVGAGGLAVPGAQRVQRPPQRASPEVQVARQPNQDRAVEHGAHEHGCGQTIHLGPLVHQEAPPINHAHPRRKGSHLW